MQAPWTRRRFLLVAGGSTIGLARLRPSARAEGRPLQPEERETLRAVADQIIPKGDGMPSATDGGATRYLIDLAGRDSDVRRQLEAALAAVEKAARERAGTSFQRLGSSDAIAILVDFERADPATFTATRNLLYEAYYAQGVVGDRLGFVFRAADETGPAPEPFDESLVARVRSMPPLYRRAL
jgi:Gluconate 2-dehydrogenase subunit 3